MNAVELEFEARRNRRDDWRRIIARLAVRTRKAMAARRAARHMRELSPELLKDIGVHACEIDWVVRNGRTDRHGLCW